MTVLNQMPEPKIIPLAPVSVTMIGTGSGTGDGSVPMKDGTLATTPGAQPNLIVNVISPIRAMIVRFVNQFMTTLVGLVGAAMTPAGNNILPANDFMDLVVNCAVLSVAGAGFGLLKDCVTILGRLEGKYPLLTGSV